MRSAPSLLENRMGSSVLADENITVTENTKNIIVIEPADTVEVDANDRKIIVHSVVSHLYLFFLSFLCNKNFLSSNIRY